MAINLHKETWWGATKEWAQLILLLLYVYASIPFRLVWRYLTGIVSPKKFVGKDVEKVFADLDVSSKVMLCMMVRRYGLEENYVYFRLPHWHPARMRLVFYRGLFLKFVLTTDQNWI